MKKTLTILAFAAAVVLAGCQREAENPNAGLREIKFKASLEIETKVTATSFEEGDIVGLSIGEPIDVSRTKLTYTGGALTPEKTLFWPESMPYLAEASFMAWYPYGIFGNLDPMDGGVSFIIARDQYKEGEYEGSDLLAAVTSASPSQEAVSLAFHHMFSRFKLKVVDQLTSDSFRDLQADSFRSIALNGLMRGAEVNLADGTVNAAATSEDTTYPMRAGEMNYWAIVVPQTVTPEIVVTLNSGETRTYVPSAPITFTSGKQLSATLTLSDDAISFQWNIVDWEDDDTEIVLVRPNGGQPNNEIWYTSTDGEVIEPTYNADGFGANIISNTYKDGKGVIIFDGDVTEIPWGAFRTNEKLSAFSMPNSVTQISGSAFYYCTALTDIKLSENLKSIYRFAFSTCPITSITLPESLEYIEEYNIFQSCGYLEAIYGKFASEDNRCLIVNDELLAFAPAGLTNYTVPEGITAIQGYAFYDCANLTEIVLPSSLKSVSTFAFGFCNGISGFVIPDSVEFIDHSAFYDCRSLTSFQGKFASNDNRCLIIDGTVVAYAYCGIREYYIPEGVTAIATCTFSGYNYTLETIHFPSTLLVIGQEAFERCQSLHDVIIPSSVTRIEDYAFLWCRAMNTITVLAVTPPELGESAFDDTGNAPIYVPAESLEAYKAADGWSVYADRIQPISEEQPNNEIWYTSTDGNIVELYRTTGFDASVVSNTYSNGRGVVSFDGPISKVGEFAFNMCSTLLTVSLPECVTNLETACFQSCSNLESIHFPDGVSVIGNSAFNSCSKLSNLVLPQKLVSIGEAAFMSCSSIVSLDFPDAVENLVNNPFTYCTSLESFSGRIASQDGRCVIIDNTIMSFAPAGLTDYSIPAGVTGVGDGAFSDMNNLTFIEIPDSVTEIGDHAFKGCSRITTFDIPDGVSSVGNMAFACNPSLERFTGVFATADGRGLVVNGSLVGFAEHGLTSWDIPAGVTAIGPGAFFSCYELTSVTIPETVTEIGKQAFSFCTSIQSVTIPQNVESIGYQSFYYANSITEFYVLPATPPTIGVKMLTSSDLTIYVPSASVEDYKTALYWSAYADRIQAIEE